MSKTNDPSSKQHPPNFHHLTWRWALCISIPCGLIIAAVPALMSLAENTFTVEVVLWVVSFGLIGTTFGGVLGMMLGTAHWLILSFLFLLREGKGTSPTDSMSHRDNAIKHVKRFVLGSLLLGSVGMVIAIVLVFTMPPLIVGGMEQVALCQDAIRSGPTVVARLGAVGTVDCVYHLCAFESGARMDQNGRLAELVKTGTFVFDVSGSTGSQRYAISWEGEGETFMVTELKQVVPWQTRVLCF